MFWEGGRRKRGERRARVYSLGSNDEVLVFLCTPGWATHSTLGVAGLSERFKLVRQAGSAGTANNMQAALALEAKNPGTLPTPALTRLTSLCKFKMALERCCVAAGEGAEPTRLG